jgi:hypothetical protein
MSVVSFNKAKKAKARTEAKTSAAENRAKFGRTKAQKASETSAAEKAARALDQAKRER